MSGIYELAIRQGAMFGGLAMVMLVSYIVFNAVLGDKTKSR